jgi:hypothetical protein
MDIDSDDELFVRYLSKYDTPARVIKDRANLFDEFTDTRFHERFRLSKVSALVLLTKIDSELEYVTDRNSALPPILQLLNALRFCATGSHRYLLMCNIIQQSELNVANKWKSLSRKYKEVIDSSRRTSTGAMKWDFFTEMDDIIGDKQSIHCPHVMSSMKAPTPMSSHCSRQGTVTQMRRRQRWYRAYCGFGIQRGFNFTDQ